MQIVQRDGAQWYDVRPPARFDTTLFADKTILDGTSFKLEGASNFKQYSCRIRSLNDAQTSVWNYKAFTTINSTGIFESPGNDINLYPNPAAEQIFLESRLTKGKVEIFSALGLKALETEWSDNIDVSGLVRGIYYLRIGASVNKFIKL